MEKFNFQGKRLFKLLKKDYSRGKIPRERERNKYIEKNKIK